MITISNSTGRTVNIYNDSYRVQLGADETVEISEEDLAGDYKLQFCFADLKTVQRIVEKKWKKSERTGRYHCEYKNELLFPIITVLNVQNVSQVALESNSVELRTFLWMFKTVHFHEIVCNCTPSKPEKSQLMFLSEADKQQFLKLMRRSNVVFFPAALIAIPTMLCHLFMEEGTFMDKVILFFLYGTFIFVALSDFYYTKKARKWGISTGRQGNGSLVTSPESAEQDSQ